MFPNSCRVLLSVTSGSSSGSGRYTSSLSHAAAGHDALRFSKRPRAGCVGKKGRQGGRTRAEEEWAAVIQW